MSSSEDASIVRQVAVTGARTSVLETAGTSWNVAFSSDTWWTPPFSITFPADGTEERTLSLWPLGVVTGKVIAGAKDLPLPASIALVVESPPTPEKSQEIPRGTRFECPVAATGDWTCKLPATVLDLALRSTGMTPHYRWDVTVSAQKPHHLGSFRLQRGASVSAWLDRNTAGTLSKPARARLVLPVTSEPSAASMRLRAPVAEADFTARGMVQLGPVPPGTYILEVEASGFATSRIGPLEVYEGRETAFRKAIELQRPFSVEVAVQPAVDPSGSRWRIEWRRQNDLIAYAETPAVIQTVDDDGKAAIPGQSTGTFVLKIRDAGGNVIRDDVVAVADESQARIDVHLDLHRVEGTVSLGGEPVSATLWFGTRSGTERIQFTAADDGAFQGYLPRLGRWSVEVLHDPDIRSIVDVEAGSGKLEIRLAATRLSGWVVGTDGQRVKRGSVMVHAGKKTFTSTLDPEDGRFVFRGLPAGPVMLGARNLQTGETAAAVKVELSENKPAEGIELRIEPLKKLTGKVVSRGQSAIGARVSAVALDLGTQTVRNSVTDIDGRFSVPVAESARRAHITVAAPGRTLQSFHLPVGEGEIVLEIAAVGGTVEVNAPGAFRLTRDGIELQMNDLFDWMAAHGDPLTAPVLRIPDLAPGHYQLCPIGGPPALCQSGNLPPGGSLRLAIRENSPAP